MIRSVAIGGFSAGFLPVPAGITSDRFGPRRVIVFSWLVAFLGTVLIALAPNWQLDTLGIVVLIRQSVSYQVFLKRNKKRSKNE